MTGSTERRLKEALADYMDRDVWTLTHEELEEAEAALKCARTDGSAEGNEALERAASKALEALNRHRQARVCHRYWRDRADGRHD